MRSRIPPGGLPLEEVLTFGIQIADALDASHAMKILHRDIKTENIFVTRRNNAKILDFGIAKLESESAAALERTGARTTVGDLTKPGGVVGTVAYMSPEHARGEGLDARSDLFSLGAVLYEMATGRRAFPGSTPGIVYSAILSQDPVRPVAVRPDLPPGLEQIILKLLRKEPQKRYPSAAALRDDLMQLKLQIDSGTFTKSGNHLRIAGDLPQSTLAESPVGGTYQTLLKQQTSRKNLLTWLAAAIVVAFAGLFSYFLSIPEYYNFIAIGDFGAQPSGCFRELGSGGTRTFRARWIGEQ